MAEVDDKNEPEEEEIIRKNKHYRRHCPRCGGALRQADLQKTASLIKKREPNERLFVYICDGRNKRLPHPPKIIEIVELSIEGKELQTIIKTIGLPEEKFDDVMYMWEQWARERFKPKTWIGQPGQTIHVTAKKVKGT